MPIDKHGKKEKEEISDSSNAEESAEEEAEEVEEEEEKTSNQESNDDEEEIPTTSKFIKPRKKLKPVTTEQKNRSPKQTKKEVTIKEPKKVIIRKRTKDAIADDEELEMEEASLKVAIIQPRKPGDDKKAKEKKSTKKDEKEEDKDEGRKNWDSRNIDYNLYNESPDNIKVVRILLSSTVTLESKMIEASADKKGLTYDMAALVFARKTRGNKSFEFNLPMTLAPSIREGLDRIMEKNANFYAKRCLTLTQANASKRD